MRFGDRSYLEAVAAAVLAAVRDACFSLGIEVERLPLSPAVFLQRRTRGVALKTVRRSSPPFSMPPHRLSPA